MAGAALRATASDEVGDVRCKQKGRARAGDKTTLLHVPPILHCCLRARYTTGSGRRVCSLKCGWCVLRRQWISMRGLSVRVSCIASARGRTSSPSSPSAKGRSGSAQRRKVWGVSAPARLVEGRARILVIVDDPDAFVERAVGAGATETSPIAIEHGWRLGRIVDPFGHEWEIGRPPAEWPPVPS